MDKDLATIADAFRILGALFYRAPGDPELAGVRDYLSSGGLVADWPWGTPTELVSIADDFSAVPDEAELAQQYQRLFIGPDALPAPPWASVYLDRENSLWGDSTFRLADFCAEQGIECTSEQNEPPDHFGLLCSLFALLAESRDRALLCDFLAEHVLPWSGRYLELFSSAAQDSPFYRASAALENCSLNGLQAQWQIEPHQLRLRYPPTDDEMEAVQ